MRLAEPSFAPLGACKHLALIGLHSIPHVLRGDCYYGRAVGEVFAALLADGPTIFGGAALTPMLAFTTGPVKVRSASPPAASPRLYPLRHTDQGAQTARSQVHDDLPHLDREGDYADGFSSGNSTQSAPQASPV